MRMKKRLIKLEMEVQQLSEVVQELMDLSTKPSVQNVVVQTERIDHRKLPRRRAVARNAAKRWTKNEIELAMKLRSKGATFAEVGEVMGRSDRSVQSAFIRYGIK